MKKKSTKPRKKLPTELIKYLKEKGIKYDILEHRTVYTAIDAANTMKKKMDEIVKSLLVKADKYYYIVCLPANENLDFKKLKKAVENVVGAKVKAVEIPNEKTMQKILKIRNEGTSAFGGFYKLPVIAEKKLARLKKAIFSSGGFNHSVEMAVKDFIKLENAILDSFGIKKKVKLQETIKKAPARKKSAVKKKRAVKKGPAKKRVIKKKKKK